MCLSNSSSSSLCKFFVVTFILVNHGDSIAAQGNNSTQIVNIGAVIDMNSHTGKEEKVAMEIAVQEFNNSSSNKYKLVLNVTDSGGDLLRANTAANDLIKQHGAQAIIGLETWQQTVLVAEFANQARVPVLSFAAPSITPPLMSIRWPFLLTMAYNDSLQMDCLASIVSSYGWREVIVIYEDDTYGAESGILALLSDALGNIGTEIEHWLAFPPISALSDPDTTVREELEKVTMSMQSRLFIIVRSSVQLASRLFSQANQLGLMGRDSVWITTDSITSLFNTFNSSVMQSMQGVIGIKTHFSETSPVFNDFSTNFQNSFRSAYPEEDKSEPGINALRAYDAVSIITKAVENSTYNGTSTTLLQTLLGNRFNGLSGKIQFNNRELSSPNIYQIVNVFGKSYAKLKFWSSNSGFYDDDEMMGRQGGGDGDTGVLGDTVHWPGGLTGKVPKGWSMPTDEHPLKIAVPGRASFEKFVKVKPGEDPTGFCIEVFEEARKRLAYDLPYKYHAFNGTYEQLIDQVYYKNFTAAVGDVTILANRSKFVDFTQPYTESGLYMVVPVKSHEKVWLFMKPFTKSMWLVTLAVFIYTMFVVWFLEHRSNSDFRGSWKSQLGTALWFTFSTLFFAHRERLNSNYSRVVIVVWLFIVFVVTSSYTASLTSMLTVQRLEPTVSDFHKLLWGNSMVGCDGDSFVNQYLEDVLGFHPDRIMTINNQNKYPEAFRKKQIKAAFLELPYEKVFLAENCKHYKDAGLTYRFGGLAFAFPKGSPLARDISEAILKISEDGNITRLEEKWFPKSSECSQDDGNKSMSLENFWVLFLATITTSTIMLLLYIVQLFRKFRDHSDFPDPDESLWNRIYRIASYINKETPILVQPLNGANENWITPNEECLTTYNATGNQQGESPVRMFEMSETRIGKLETRKRFSSLASFPGRDRPVPAYRVGDSEWQHFPSST